MSDADVQAIFDAGLREIRLAVARGEISDADALAYEHGFRERLGLPLDAPEPAPGEPLAPEPVAAVPAPVEQHALKPQPPAPIIIPHLRDVTISLRTALIAGGVALVAIALPLIASLGSSGGSRHPLAAATVNLDVEFVVDVSGDAATFATRASALASALEATTGTPSALADPVSAFSTASANLRVAITSARGANGPLELQFAAAVSSVEQAAEMVGDWIHDPGSKDKEQAARDAIRVASDSWNSVTRTLWSHGGAAPPQIGPA